MTIDPIKLMVLATAADVNQKFARRDIAEPSSQQQENQA